MVPIRNDCLLRAGNFVLKNQGYHSKTHSLPAKIHDVILHSLAGSRKKVPNVLSRHAKRRMGARGSARTSFGMTPTFKKNFQKKKKNLKKRKKKSQTFFAKKVDVIPKEGPAYMAAPVLLLV